MTNYRNRGELTQPQQPRQRSKNFITAHRQMMDVYVSPGAWENLRAMADTNTVTRWLDNHATEFTRFEPDDYALSNREERRSKVFIPSDFSNGERKRLRHIALTTRSINHLANLTVKYQIPIHQPSITSRVGNAIEMIGNGYFV